ncbi:MAG: hypothetical protein NTX87_20390 [Planctomycetota bacterium]|nr:hypothetical protein [Planctomycetota bacterium]
MQDRYVGDIGDFGKFGLLRHLFLGEDWRLGIIWYLVPDEVHNRDGRHIDYLDRPEEYRLCDPIVFDEIQRLVRGNQRRVAAFDLAKLLGPKAVSYSSRLSFGRISAHSPEDRKERLSVRQDWLNRAMTAIEGCNAIFLDPDNGLQVSSTAAHEKKGPKYAFFQEVATLASAERVCVVYHHLGQNQPHETTMAEYIPQLEMATGRHGLVMAVRFHRVSCRAYFILATKASRDTVSRKLDELLASPWRHCFERVV